jgi:hypothetical protein
MAISNLQIQSWHSELMTILQEKNIFCIHNQLKTTAVHTDTYPHNVHAFYFAFSTNVCTYHAALFGYVSIWAL